jgi:hypothetical protein
LYKPNVIGKRLEHKGNTEKKNNGYVVSVNEISTDQLGKRVLLTWKGVTPPTQDKY